MENTEIETGISFEPATDTYRLHSDRRSDASVATAVVRGVAAVTNTLPTDFDPLYETLDPDALGQLYEPVDGGSPRTDGWVSFEFGDCIVVVDASGEIEITPADDANPITASVPRHLRDR